jgi:mRNA interferase RelE/StbE
MSYSVEFSQKATKQLGKMDGAHARIIYAWIGKNLVGTDDPYSKGRPLVRDRKGQWRYRVGSFRLICEILQDKLIILVLDLGDRKDIYNN